MDDFRYFSLAYFGYILLSAGIVAAVFFAFRTMPERTKLAALYALALFNVMLHFLKSFIWPHLAGTGFSYRNTFYNVCAALLILTPFFLWKREGAWRETVAYAGCAGGAGAICIPHWFIGRSILRWEFLRFWVCHELLLLTSLLPVLWKLVSFRFANFWKIGLCFFAILAGILLNDVLCVCAGLVGNGVEDLYAALYELNPLYAVHPPEEGFRWLVAAIGAMSPKLFRGGDGSGYTPLLWYFIPFYLLITALAAVVGWSLAHMTAPCESGNKTASPPPFPSGRDNNFSRCA